MDEKDMTLPREPSRAAELTRGGLLARNAALSVSGELVPMAAALVAIPLLVRGLGTDRFGLLSLAWVVIGYFSLFDLGLGKALTKAVASGVGEDRQIEIPGLVSTGLLLIGLLGILGGLTLTAASPWLVQDWLRIPAALHGEALTCFRLLALGVPAVVAASGFRGLLEAQQRVGLILSIRTPVGVLSYAAPLAVLPFSSSLVPVVAVLVGIRYVSLLLFAGACQRVLPAWMRRARLAGSETVALLRFGGWMTVSNILSPLLTMLDRFVIGSIVSVGAVAYYAVPLDIANYAGIVPGAIATVLFPAFATTFPRDRARTAKLFAAGLKVNLALMFPCALALMAFGSEGLDFWLGREFGRAGAPVIRWVAIGLLISALARVAFWLVQGVGRPDLPARFHLLEIVIYLPLLWWATRSFGIAGAAAAWTVRIVLDAGLLFRASARIVPLPRSDRSSFAAVTASALAVLALIPRLGNAPLRLAAVGAIAAAFPWLCWRFLLSSEERISLREAIRSRGAANGSFRGSA